MEDRSLQLPSVEPLLKLPTSAIVQFVSNKNEAQLLLDIGELAHEFDHLMSYLSQWLEHQEYLKDDYQRAAGMRALQMSSLAPLTYQARLVNLHGVKVLQSRITACLQKLQRHMEMIQIFANQNASFASELRLCGLGDRADQRNRLAETELMLASRLLKFLGGCDSFFDEQPLALAMDSVVGVASGGRSEAARQAFPGEDGGFGPSTILVGTSTRLAGNKRPLPTEEKRAGGSRDCGGDGRRASREIADHDRHDNRRDLKQPKVSRREDVEITSSHNGRDTTRIAADDALATRQPTSDWQPPAEDNGGGCSAPFTPPVARAATGAGVDPGGNAVAGVATLSACSSDGSAPSNASSSPALAVASPAPRPSRRPADGRAGASSIGEGGNATGGDFRDSLDGGGVEGAPLPEEHPPLPLSSATSSSSQTQTQPSTREPSPPPAFSTQEASSPLDYYMHSENDQDASEVIDHDRKGKHSNEGRQQGEDEGNPSIPPRDGCPVSGVGTGSGCRPSDSGAVLMARPAGSSGGEEGGDEEEGGYDDDMADSADTLKDIVTAPMLDQRASSPPLPEDEIAASANDAAADRLVLRTLIGHDAGEQYTEDHVARFKEEDGAQVNGQALNDDAEQQHGEPDGTAFMQKVKMEGCAFLSYYSAGPDVAGGAETEAGAGESSAIKGRELDH